MQPTGNHEWDKVGMQFNLSPNGVLDAPPAWSVLPADPGLTLTPAADGLSATLFATIDFATFEVTAQAPADNPSTEPLESVSETFTGSFSHSKASSLGGTFSEIPVPVP